MWKCKENEKLGIQGKKKADSRDGGKKMKNLRCKEVRETSSRKRVSD